MTMLLEVLPLHDVEDAERFCRAVLEVELRAQGAYLDRDRHEDVVTYLIAEGWKLSLRYRSELNTSFSHYAWPLLRCRVRDWQRIALGDSRRRSGPPPLSLDALRESDDFVEEATQGDLHDQLERQVLRSGVRRVPVAA